MHIEFEVSRDEEYFQAFHRRTVTRVVRRIVGLAVVLAVVGPIMVWLSSGEGFGTVAGIVALIASPALLIRARRVRATLLRVPDGWTSPRRYVITDDALESRTALTETRWDWKAVQTVEVMPHAFLFRQAGGLAFDVPRAPLTEAQDAELRTLIAARGLGSGAGAL